MQDQNNPTSGPDQNERAATWASTMDGHGELSLRTAHSDSHAAIAVAAPIGRIAREGHTEVALADGATRADGAGDRHVSEEPDPLRTCFERDRDRILHATAFRRLAGKTQVFVFPEDHQRSRLTHALEVAQVARAIASSLGLNVPLAEAIALGHDCGHGPGGHASEDALSPYVDGGYDHARWGADVTLAPLNLCSETLDGIRNHSWSLPAPSTPEGEVVSWADRIAYVCHDFEDAEHTGIVAAHELPELVRERCGTSRREQLGAFIGSVVTASAQCGRIGMEADMADALSAFRSFDYERIYLRPESLDQAARVIGLLQALVDHFTAEPTNLPSDALPEPDASGSDVVRLAAVRHVSGMTDRYACRSAMRLLDWEVDRLPAALGMSS